jgi:primosomal protein N' (replication factor Y)
VFPAVAQVYVDVPLPHLDHVFDYGIPAEFLDQVSPGIRVKVRFAGRIVNAWVVAVEPTSDIGKLSPIHKIVSPAPVMPPGLIRLIRAVADHMAGTFADVARLAVPPRHAATEKAAVREQGRDRPDISASWSSSPLALYPAGEGFLESIRSGGSPRAAWSVVPVAERIGDWAEGFAAAAAACVESGRSAVLLVPDARDCPVLLAALERRIDPSLIVRQTADEGPAARYRGYLAALHGRARVVVGSRAAAYTPVVDCGLIALWDDGDGSYREQRAPYPATRDVVALRAAQEHTAVLFASHARSCQLEAWVERGWLTPIATTTVEARRQAPLVRVAEDPRPGAATARMPRDVFTTIRSGLVEGPVLVQTPYRGHRRHLSCAGCGGAVLCSCGGPFAEEDTGWGQAATRCQWCGRDLGQWQCAQCGGRRVRAVVAGDRRIAEELARAFPGTTLLSSDAQAPVSAVGEEPLIVVSTPGCEPAAAQGYAAAVILDAQAALARPDLAAAEEAMRRWLAVVALVRAAERGGVVAVVGPAQDRAIQALVRLDPAGFAARELEDRRAAQFPPAVRLATIRGEATAVAEAADALSVEPGFTLTEPIPVETTRPRGDESEGVEETMLLVRAPADQGERLAVSLHACAARRSRAKATPLTIRIDPVSL